MSSPFIYPAYFRPFHQHGRSHTALPPLFVGAAHQPWYAPRLGFANSLTRWKRSRTDQEIANGRRLIQVHRNCSEVAPTTTVISIIFWESRKEFAFTSADFLKLLQFLFEIQLDDVVKKNCRRNLDGLNNWTTIEKTGDNQALFDLVTMFLNPEAVPTRRSFKIFPWGSIDTAIGIFLNKEVLKGFHLTLPEWVSCTILSTNDVHRPTQGFSPNDLHVSPSYSHHLTHVPALRSPAPFLSESLITVFPNCNQSPHRPSSRGSGETLYLAAGSAQFRYTFGDHGHGTASIDPWSSSQRPFLPAADFPFNSFEGMQSFIDPLALREGQPGFLLPSLPTFLPSSSSRSEQPDFAPGNPGFQSGAD